MAHFRKQVRTAAQTRLAAIPGLTVVENVAETLRESQLPAAVVSTPFTESTAPAADQDGSGNLSAHDVTLLIVIVLEGDVGEDDVDELAIEIEEAFSDNLDGLARFVAPIAEMSYSLDRQMDSEGQVWLTFAEFEMSVGVVTTLGNPEEVL